MTVTGLFAVNKRAGVFSSRVIRTIKQIVCQNVGKRRREVRVGHGGTLDSFASGVMVIAVNRPSTKLLAHYLSSVDKRYTARGCFGYSTNTLCPEGEKTHFAPFDHITEEQMQNTLNNFIGITQQLPPNFSSKQINGKSLREYSLQNNIDSVEIPSKQIEIREIKLLEWSPPYFTIGNALV